VSGSGGGISVVCVYNDPGVRRECLDRSLAAAPPEIDVDYIAVDNTGHAFSSAGAALNHGVRQARHAVVVLVHQDVYLHSVARLVTVARTFVDDPGGGLLGANGVTAEGRSVGRLRDRVQLIGAPAPAPTAVDSLDEVLVLAPRELLLEHPLTEDPDLAWHAYAVEYGLRLRRLGYRVGAVDCAVTHNSLTVNLARLDVAHRRVAELYPDLGPVRTTCGTVGAVVPRWRTAGPVRRHGWRWRWLKLSLQSRRARRRLAVPVVLSDIRHEVDLLHFSEDAPLHLVNADGGLGGFTHSGGAAVRFTRLGKPVVMQAVDTPEAAAALLGTAAPWTSVLVLGVGLEDLDRVVVGADADRPWVLGVQPGACWLLGGPAARALPVEWRRPASVPLGQRRSLVAADS
jgi:hypothetical protein